MRVLFVGSKRMGLRVLREMHAVRPESIAGVVALDDRRDLRSEYEALRGFAVEHRFPLSIGDDLAGDIKELHPDLVIVSGWYRLFSKELLASVPRGFLGFHGSLLPKYRGGSPVVWQMIRGEQQVGLSLFSITEGMDEGPIWAQRSVKVTAEDDIANVLDKLEFAAVGLVREVYPAILDGTAACHEQQHHAATYCAARTSWDGLIDWTRTAPEVYDFIRAQAPPYPGAFTVRRGATVKVMRARPLPTVYYGQPGQVVRITPEGPVVCCGEDTALLLLHCDDSGPWTTNVRLGE